MTGTQLLRYALRHLPTVLILNAILIASSVEGIVWLWWLTLASLLFHLYQINGPFFRDYKAACEQAEQLEKWERISMAEYHAEQLEKWERISMAEYHAERLEHERIMRDLENTF